MAIPKNISREHLIKAIEKIDKEGVPPDADSRYYDVIHNKKKYPPKVIVSYANIFANGFELNRNSFAGGKGTPCFKLLEAHKFEIMPKEIEQTVSSKQFWVEKTIVNGRKDRIEGERALGKALWSPQKSKDGSDIYKNMRLVRNGDLVLHLINNKLISGISIVKKKAIETDGIDATEWKGPAYLIELEKYVELYPKIDRKDILNEVNETRLLSIANTSEVFFNSNLDLRQGAYLTPCSIELLTLINEVYFRLSSNKLPHTNDINFKASTSDEMIETQFSYISFLNDTSKAGLTFSPLLVQRFVASLCTKPFVICSGLSGSGKTKLAQAFVQWICQDETQYSIVPVGADWTNREPLLGYPNALNQEEYIKPENGALDIIIDANHHPELPYFLILDEMNLSHVERYFADFLSVMETKGEICLYDKSLKRKIVPSTLCLPPNLFIIGTVNIDETTYMFSPKVLDRANTIEFRVSQNEMESFLGDIKEINMKHLVGKGADMSNSFLKMASNTTFLTDDIGEINIILLKFFGELSKTGAEFGYRSAREISKLINQLSIIDKDLSTNEKVDIAIMQKLLPKLHGSRRKLTPILETLGSFCITDDLKIVKDVFQKPDFKFNVSDVLYPLSLEKIARMYKGALENGFASYAEA